MEKVAGDGEEETEYESDPEEVKISLKMRRREASDDEDGEEEERRAAVSVRSGIVGDSDGDSDGQGAAAEYDDDEEEEDDDDDEEYYDEQEEFEEEEEIVGGEEYEEATREVGEGGEIRDLAVQGGGEGGDAGVAGGGGGGGGEGEEKKENEPFAVPTSGAFYMHDDRFRDNNAGGRHRRTFGGRKLWESKDDRKWGHDKFEELNSEDRHYEGGRRSSRGSYRGRGKTRGTERGYARGGRMRGYNGNNNLGAPAKDVRGRGPRRYQPSAKTRSETVSQHYKQSGRSVDSHAGSVEGASTRDSLKLNVEHEQVPAKKVASNLNSASPPFYPSGSSNNDNSWTQKKEVQVGNHNRNRRPSVADHNFPISHSNNMMRGKNVVDSMGMDKLNIDGSALPATIKPLNGAHMPPSASPSTGQPRVQGRDGVPSGSAIFQPQTNIQNNKVSSSAAQPSQRLPVQSRGQFSQQASGQQFIQHSLSGSQTTSPPKGPLVTTFEPRNFESSIEPGNSKFAGAGKGKGSVQGTGRGGLMYGGAQVMGSSGNVSAGHGDPNLPAFFPVMQLGAQHPGGIPAVGMAFPGYVAQPNGLGNSEMTWLPVLSGALGASYCPPYVAVDGYNPRPTGQTSALPAPSKDNYHSKSTDEVKPLQRSDVNDEFIQRQNKPRRYSEMKFSQ